ncbi:transcriptional repressor TCF25-domain-containing protein [Mycena rebaudengoi]|nr:transcriptional repressor TCF25-domain-containing protein [Mycena rebaudengoi]
MPPRLSKRQQRELEELEALGGPSKLPEESSDEDLPKPTSRAQGNPGFAALFTPGEDDQDSDEGAAATPKSRKKKKKKAVESARSQTPVVAESPRGSISAPPIIKNEKKAAKKAKARERKADKDEFNQAIAELSIKYPELQAVANSDQQGISSLSTSLASLLAVSLTHLDSEAEMRKFFGARVIQANKSGAGSATRRQTAQRSNLTRPPAVWFQTAPREGLSLRALAEHEINSKLAQHEWEPTDEKWWTVEYSKKYRSVTKSFMAVVLSGDPNGFYGLLQKFPWHGDTLLQLAEVFRHREEYAQAVEYVDRALFSYERAFFGSFNFTTGLNRLDFDHIENRPFFLAVHRQTTDLQRRGCVRTAFEFARLLLSLDPGNDPHGAFLHLDFLSVKTGMGQWLVDMFDLFAGRRMAKQNKFMDVRVDPSVLPGWAYARALALRTSKNEDPTAGTVALLEAIRSFPSVVPLLADKLDVSLPNSIRSHRDFKIETDANNLRAPEGTLHLLSHLYAQRSFPLWKDESAWFTSTVSAEFASLPSSLPITQRRKDFLSLYEDSNLRHSVYRHIMVLETSYRRLFSYIPRQVLNAKTLACDPLPPPTAVTLYNDEFFAGVDDLRAFTATPTARQRALQDRVLAQMIPDAGIRQQLQAFFNAMPAVQERFPEGVVQFAEAAAQMEPEDLEALMLAAVMGNEDGEGRPPGQIPGFVPGQMPGFVNWDEPAPGEPVPPQPDDEDVESSDDEDEEVVSPLPLRMLRNVIGRFWGGYGAVHDDSSSEEEEVVNP